ncbi:MAG: GNAT family N-acetyltransferase [Bacteroidales bacterium]|nr:GNAT family N-acetyltransferase [Bacteroidales bacterium]
MCRWWGGYIYGQYLAVSPIAQRVGVGKMLLEKGVEIAKENNLTYISGDTSQYATWSIKWHKRMGYKIVGYDSFYKTDYYSYIFRLQIKPSILWNNALFCKIVFLFSYIKTKAMMTNKGELTFFGRLVSRIYRLFR